MTARRRQQFTCEYCHGEYSMDDRRELDGQEMCCYCYDAKMRERLDGYVNRHSFKPDPVFHPSVSEVDDGEPHLGVELETGGAEVEKAIEAARAITTVTGDVYLKKDATIPDHGFEIVSHPMTLDFHEGDMSDMWWLIFDGCRRKGFLSHDLGGVVGMHVHVSRDVLTEGTWRVIDAFVNLNQHEFERLARRKDGGMYSYMCCCPGYAGSRYRAINFQNENTIEFRMWNGTLICDTFMATLELTHSLFAAGAEFERKGSVLVPCGGSDWHDYDYVLEDYRKTWVNAMKKDARYARALEYAKLKGAFSQELCGMDSMFEMPEHEEGMAAE